MISIKCKNPDCKKVIEVSSGIREDKRPKYCSRSCAAKNNNKLFPKRYAMKECSHPNCDTKVYIALKFCEEHETTGNPHDNIMRNTEDKKCKGCENNFSTFLSYKKFCSNECRNTFYRKNSPKDKNLKIVCPRCNGRKTPQAMFCMKCNGAVKSEEKVQNWLSGEWDGNCGKNTLSTTIRKYLLDLAEYKCSKCGFNKNHPVDGKSILEINHIDGDGNNHSPDNLEVLCPNCHALTENYRGRNYGNGRNQYYLRVDL